MKKKYWTAVTKGLCIVLAAAMVLAAWPMRAQAQGNAPQRLEIRGEATAFSAGHGFSMAITANGHLLGWGRNSSGQLGSGSQTARARPMFIMENAVSVSTSMTDTMVIDTDGVLWGWGSNRVGQLGDGTTAQRLSRVKIMENVIAVSTTCSDGSNLSSHTMAITADGVLWGWGNNSAGQLGDGTTTNRLLPVRIMDNVVSVSAGLYYTAAITADGVLWGWGTGGIHQPTGRLRPVRIMENVAAVSVGRYTVDGYSIGAITNDGVLWHWDYDTTDAPVRVMDNVVAVSMGDGIGMAITNDNVLWGWGRSWSVGGLLGEGTYGTYVPRQNPVQVMENVKAVSVNRQHVLAQTTDGALWGWGSNSSGQLGADPDHLQARVKIIGNILSPGEMPSSAPVNEAIFTNTISAGGDQSLAIDADGVLWGWGSGWRSIDHIPTRVSNIGNLAAVSTSGEHTVFITADGALWGWGSNFRGRLGLPHQGSGRIGEVTQPMYMMADIVYTSATSRQLTVAIDDDGVLWGWGNVELGNNHENRSHPVRIMENIVSVSISIASVALAIDADGVLWGWGWNSNGQVGNGTTSSLTQPVRIMDNVAAVSVGGSHTMAITNDGKLWGWGSNEHGQLGISGLGVHLQPVYIMDNVSAVAAGTRNTMVITTDTAIEIYRPVHIMDNVIEVSMGDNHALALTADGVLWAWGENRHGQLGDGTTTSSSTPVRVRDVFDLTRPAAADDE